MNSILNHLIQNEYMVVQGLLSEQQCSQIIAELKNKLYEKATPVVGKRKVKQNFFRMELDPAKNKNSIIYKTVKHLENTLSNSFKTDICFNDFWVQKYSQEHKVGISPHKDSKKYINCIVIILLKGDSNFFIYEDKNGNNPKLILANISDIIILRAPGIGGSDMGPYHGVNNITKERITLTLRQVKL